MVIKEMKIKSAILGITTFAFLFVSVVSPISAQFLTSPTVTPTPTLITSPITGSTPTATPTLRIGSPDGATQAATSPAAGNALPTLVILAASILLISLGSFTWKKLSSQSA